MASENFVQIGKLLNKVRSLNDNLYQSCVPIFKEVDGANEDEKIYNYGKKLLNSYDVVVNDFIKTFQDVILYESFKIHIFENEFSRRLKKPSNPQRRATFETFTNPIVPLKYDGEKLERILKLYKRDVKKQVFVRNRQDVFPISTNVEELESAFQSVDAFMDFYNNQWLVLQNSNAIVEYNHILECINLNVASGALKTINVHGKTAKEINTLLKSLITKMSKPSSNFNNYAEVVEATTGVSEQPVVTNTPKESMLFMPSADLLADLDTNVLASAYNLEYAKVLENIIDVDDFGFDVYDQENQTIEKHVDSKIVGVLCDENLFKFDEGLNKQMSDENGATLTRQTFWHVWQTIDIRMFCNCIVLIDDGEEPEPTPGEEFEIIIPENFEIPNDYNFTLSYKGTFPEELKNDSVTLVPSGVDGSDVVYSITVDEENKTISFTIVNPNDVDGVIDGEGGVFFVFIDTQHGITVSKIMANINTIKNIPISYKITIANKPYGESVVISDVTADTVLTIPVLPDNVSPAVDIGGTTGAFTVYDGSQSVVYQAQITTVNNTVTIPANTLPDLDNYTAVFVCQYGSAVWDIDGTV